MSTNSELYGDVANVETALNSAYASVTAFQDHRYWALLIYHCVEAVVRALLLIWWDMPGGE